MMHSGKAAAYYYDVQGSGEPVILLHGFTGTHNTWEKMRSTLNRTFQTIAFDLPGHGQTLDGQVEMQAFCEDLQVFLDETGISGCHLIGYSMGGRAALSFAAAYPDQVKSLILESASPGLQSEDERVARCRQDEKLAAMLEREGVEAFVGQWERLPLFATQQQLPETVRRMIRDERLSQHAAGLAASLRHMGTGSQEPVWEKLSVLDMPVLLLAGALDPKFVRLNTAMHETLPNSRLTVIPQAGHAIHVENPQIFDKVIMEFLLAHS